MLKVNHITGEHIHNDAKTMRERPHNRDGVYGRCLISIWMHVKTAQVVNMTLAYTWMSVCVPINYSGYDRKVWR